MGDSWSVQYEVATTLETKSSDIEVLRTCQLFQARQAFYKGDQSKEIYILAREVRSGKQSCMLHVSHLALKK